LSVRYRTYLNIVRINSKLLGILRETLRWSSTGQMFKTLFLLVFLNGKRKKNGKTGGNGKQKQERSSRDSFSHRRIINFSYDLFAFCFKSSGAVSAICTAFLLCLVVESKLASIYSLSFSLSLSLSLSISLSLSLPFSLLKKSFFAFPR
jgi:hypothetical protein